MSRNIPEDATRPVSPDWPHPEPAGAAADDEPETPVLARLPDVAASGSPDAWTGAEAAGPAAPLAAAGPPDGAGRWRGDRAGQTASPGWTAATAKGVVLAGLAALCVAAYAVILGGPGEPESGTKDPSPWPAAPTDSVASDPKAAPEGEAPLAADVARGSADQSAATDPAGPALATPAWDATPPAPPSSEGAESAESSGVGWTARAAAPPAEPVEPAAPVWTSSPVASDGVPGPADPDTELVPPGGGSETPPADCNKAPFAALAQPGGPPGSPKSSGASPAPPAASPKTPSADRAPAGRPPYPDTGAPAIGPPMTQAGGGQPQGAPRRRIDTAMRPAGGQAVLQGVIEQPPIRPRYERFGSSPY